MYCPQCGTTPSDDLKFCNSCGANLQAVRQAMVSGSGDEEFAWSKTWVAEMFLSSSELKARKEEMYRRRGITGEMRRAHDVKVGLITAFSGFAGAIVLAVLMQGIIAAGAPPPGVAAVLGRLWIVGLIPMMIGIALILHARGTTKRLAGGVQVDSRSDAIRELTAPPERYTTGGLKRPPEFSVTEDTTRPLEESSLKQ